MVQLGLLPLRGTTSLMGMAVPFYTMVEVADRLRVSRRWLEGFLKGRPSGLKRRHAPSFPNRRRHGETAKNSARVTPLLPSFMNR